VNLACRLSEPARDAMTYRRRPVIDYQASALGALRPREKRCAVLPLLSGLEQLTAAVDAEITIASSF